MTFSNSRKKGFLDKVPKVSIDSKTNKIAEKCKFNFSFFCWDQEAGQDFKDWTNEQLLKLIGKLITYSNEPLLHWQREKIGKGSGHVLEVYGSFPRISDFEHPKHVPHQALWGRFRLENSVRLVGFTIPSEYNCTEQNNSGHLFCTNTFYVVFLDKNHVFYKTKK